MHGANRVVRGGICLFYDAIKKLQQVQRVSDKVSRSCRLRGILGHKLLHIRRDLAFYVHLLLEIYLHHKFDVQPSALQVCFPRKFRLKMSVHCTVSTFSYFRDLYLVSAAFSKSCI